jgi:hypothetical protein
VKVRRIVGIALAAVALCGAIGIAQEKPKDGQAAVATAPTVPDEAKKLIADLQAADAGYARSIAVLQEKRDVLAAEFARTVNRLQLPGYELTPDLKYVKKDPPK